MAHVVALMPTYNEEDRYLSGVLERLVEQVDTVVVFDDGSTDNTVDLAIEKGATVIVRPDHVPSFREHEGAFRQAAWEAMVRETSPTAGNSWILSIDADEELYAIDNKKFKLKAFLSRQNNYSFQVINIVFYHMWNETHYRVDKLWHPTPSTRLYKYFLGGRYKDRKLACGAEPLYVAQLAGRSYRLAPDEGPFLFNSGLVMKHLGYQRDEDKKMKHTRYMDLDNGEFHNINHLESILDEDVQLLPWDRLGAK